MVQQQASLQDHIDAAMTAVAYLFGSVRRMTNFVRLGIHGLVLSGGAERQHRMRMLREAIS